MVARNAIDILKEFGHDYMDFGQLTILAMVDGEPGSVDNRWFPFSRNSKGMTLVPSVTAGEGGFVCPECGGFLSVKAEDCNFGKSKQTLYWPQCRMVWNGADHGYGPFSKHRTFRQYDKKQANNRGYTQQYNEPEPKQSTPTEPQTNVSEPIPPVAPVIQLIQPKAPTRVEHEMLASIRKMYDAGQRAFLLEGPAGSGKTSIAIMLAKDLDLPLASHSGSASSSASELSKHIHPVSGAEKLSEMMRLAIDGCVYLVDEADSIQPGELLVTNKPIEQRLFSISGREVEINPRTVFIFTANASNGGSRQYTGRFPMDMATRSRMFPVFCDYSPAIDEACSNGDAATLRAVRDLRFRVNNDPTLAKSFGPLVGTRLVKQCAMVKRAFSTRGGNDTLHKAMSIGFPLSVVVQLGL